MGIPSRNREIEGYTNRIEQVEFENHNGSSIALVNFVKLRMTHGPGKGSLSGPTVGFDLSATEGFAEETAALFDLDHHHLIVEYNHHGARSTMLANYLGRIFPDSNNIFEVLPCLDDQVMMKLASLETLSRFELKAAPKKLGPNDKHLLSSLNSSFDFAERVGAPTISIILGGEPGKKADLGDQIKNLISRMTPILRRDSELEREKDKVFRTVKVTGKESEEEPALLLDLIRGKVFGSHEIAPGPDRRFPLPERWRALKRDHARWAQIIRS